MPEAGWGGKSSPCNPGYMGIHKDPETNEYYLSFNRENPDPNFMGIYMYKLVKNRNLLKNSDFWKCRKENWSKIDYNENFITQFKVNRFPTLSTDSNCYAEVQNKNDVSKFKSGQSIYQDVNITKGSISNIEFGAKIRVAEGTGKGILRVYAMNKKKTVIDSYSLNLDNISTNYEQYIANMSVPANTSTLRFQFYIESPGVFRIDETFVNPL